MYVIQVNKRNSNGSEEAWYVLREYNDFKYLDSEILKHVSIRYRYTPSKSWMENKTYIIESFIWIIVWNRNNLSVL